MDAYINRCGGTLFLPERVQRLSFAVVIIWLWDCEGCISECELEAGVDLDIGASCVEESGEVIAVSHGCTKFDGSDDEG